MMYEIISANSSLKNKYHQKYIDSNGVERLSNRYIDDSELSTMVIDIKQAGIQLDKEHHADGSEISMFT